MKNYIKIGLFVAAFIAFARFTHRTTIEVEVIDIYDLDEDPFAEENAAGWNDTPF